jgi:hypothetical protein
MLVNPVRLIKDRMGHPLEAYWEIEVRDANGKLLTFRKFKAKSWLAQFMGVLKGHFTITAGLNANYGNSPVTDISGAVRPYPYVGQNLYNSGLCLNAGSGDSSYGLVVGSSDTPNTVTTYAMGNIIPHGSGANQLVYGQTTMENPTNPSGTNYWIFRIIRTFTNNSGASITVKEIGLIVASWAYDNANTHRFFLIARDVINPVTIPSGATLTVRYIPKITVS